jgi:hypothetical protein
LILRFSRFGEAPRATSWIKSLDPFGADQSLSSETTTTYTVLHVQTSESVMSNCWPATSTVARVAHIVRSNYRVLKSLIKSSVFPLPDATAPQFQILKDKQRRIRAGFPEKLGLRVHRAISWLGRAESEDEDLDAAFIFFWISFNAAYAAETPSFIQSSERSSFEAYFEKLIALDEDKRIYSAIWSRFSGPVRLLLDNKFVFQPFWNHQNGIDGFADWQARFDAGRERIGKALARNDTKVVLSTLFDRLYVLRNQLLHGGATWDSTVNRGQVGDGYRILAALVPVFIDLMMDSPDLDWGAPYYPVVEV